MSNLPTCLPEPKKAWAFLGPGNDGLDSLLLLTKKKQDAHAPISRVALITESKSRSRPMNVTVAAILKKQQHVVQGHNTFLTSEGLDYIFLYITDEFLNTEERGKCEKLQKFDEWGKKLIVWDSKVGDQGPLHCLNAFRHYRYLSG